MTDSYNRYIIGKVIKNSVNASQTWPHFDLVFRFKIEVEIFHHWSCVKILHVQHVLSHASVLIHRAQCFAYNSLRSRRFKHTCTVPYDYLICCVYIHQSSIFHKFIFPQPQKLFWQSIHHIEGLYVLYKNGYVGDLLVTCWRHAMAFGLIHTPFHALPLQNTTLAKVCFKQIIPIMSPNVRAPSSGRLKTSQHILLLCLW